MVQLVIGNKGKGKTKHLLDMVNDKVSTAKGSIVYLDKSTKHMFELNNKVRLINVLDYPIADNSEFIGFLTGIISQDHDLEQMYLDSFLTIACLENEGSIDSVVEKFEKLSEQFQVDFVLSISKDEHELSDNLKDKIVIAL